MKFLLNILILCSLFSSVIFALPVEKRGKNVIGKVVDGIVGIQTGGVATFFRPKTEGGPQGSCGKMEDDNSAVVAMVSKLIG